MTDTIIPSDFMENYCSGKALEFTREKEEIASSTHGTTVSGTYNINEFKYADMDVKTRPKFVSWTIDEEELERMAKEKFTNGSYEDFMADLILQLNKLRAIIYYRTCVFMGKFLGRNNTHSTNDATLCNLCVSKVECW